MKKIRSNGVFINMALLAVSTLVLRITAIAFNSWLSKKIGAGGVGLYSLILNVGGFAVTFALSGVNLAAMRLTAEAAGKRSAKALSDAMRCCMIYSLCFGCAAALLLFGFSRTIAISVLSDLRTLRPLRLFCIGLPFISLSSAMNGYFTGVRRIYKAAPVQIAEQIMGVFACVYLIGLASGGTVENACCALVFGTCVSQIISFAISFGLYLSDRKRHSSEFRVLNDGGELPTEAGTVHRANGQKMRRSGAGTACRETAGSDLPTEAGAVLRASVTKMRRSGAGTACRRMLGISLPIALSTYVRSGLLSVEHALIPAGLKKFGSSSGAALASYGVLVGMALPVVLFPHAFLAAFAGLLIPELTVYQSAGDSLRIEKTVNKVFFVTICFSAAASALMFIFADEIGNIVFGNAEAGRFIRTMAPLAVVMYLDNVTDSMLKGLGQQLYCMRVNIADAFLCTAAVYFLLPVTGINGYICIIFVSEMLNASLSIWKLGRIVRLAPFGFSFGKTERREKDRIKIVFAEQTSFSDR
ncbi:MAG: oligosaccharide flippase family protein [Clostridia bacterium]|nr:oligosaccharide flippase family protein [Clostridia bacterium]